MGTRSESGDRKTVRRRRTQGRVRVSGVLVAVVATCVKSNDTEIQYFDMNTQQPMTTIVQAPPVVPPKIQAALAFTQFCEHATNHVAQTVSGVEKIGRSLTGKEQRCYDAALQCMTEYFNDDGYGDEPRNPPGGGNAPVAPQPQVPVPAK